MRCARAISRQPRRPRLARRHCRGLGLFDALLGVILLSMLALVGGQIAGTWVDRQLMAREARALAGLARAGRLWLEGDSARAPGPGMPQTVSFGSTFADLDAARLWSDIQNTFTPGRKRTMTLQLWLADTDRVMVIARARGAPGSAIPPGVPGAVAAVPGVGAILDRPGETLLRGPDLDFDMADVNAVQPGFAQRGDLFALAHVYTAANCDAYLHRRIDPDCPDATQMGANLDMGGNDLIAVGEIVADAARVGTIDGDLVIEGELDINDALRVFGETTLEGLVVSGAARVDGTLLVGVDLLVAGDLTATGTVSGGALVFNGDLSVAGTASLGAAQADELIAGTVTAQTVFGETGTFRDLDVVDLTVTGCTGCGP